MSSTARIIYRRLYSYFGPQHWWPGESAFEVIVGAILAQNTNWQNVVKAVDNLKKAGVLGATRLYRLPLPRLAKLIKPSGYYNIKAARLRYFLKYLFGHYQGNLGKMFRRGVFQLRQELLAVKGIGPETADSILLYAGRFPVFVVDAYTKRIFSRHKLLAKGCGYHDAQRFFMKALKPEIKLFNEYHALLVRLGKEFCLKNKPKCRICPLQGFKQ